MIRVNQVTHKRWAIEKD